MTGNLWKGPKPHVVTSTQTIKYIITKAKIRSEKVKDYTSVGNKTCNKRARAPRVEENTGTDAQMCKIPVYLLEQSRHQKAPSRNLCDPKNPNSNTKMKLKNLISEQISSRHS